MSPREAKILPEEAQMASDQRLAGAGDVAAHPEGRGPSDGQAQTTHFTDDDTEVLRRLESGPGKGQW